MIDHLIQLLISTAGTFAGCYLFFCWGGRRADIGAGLAATADNVKARMQEPVIVLTVDEPLTEKTK